MTLNTGIFDVSDPQNPDRVYSAALLCRMMAKQIRDGIVHEDGNEMAVTVTDPPAMTVLVGTGTAMVQGRFCENDAALTLAVPPAHATYPRIDRVVVRLNASPGRTIDIVVKPGTAAPEPAAPALARTAETWELSLAQVRVEAGATSILSAKITDERGNTSLCGVAAPVYVPSSQVEVVGVMNMQGHALTGLPVPNAATDAARKGYVDTEIAGAIGGFGISQIAIDAGKDWNGKSITNVSSITANGVIGADLLVGKLGSRITLSDDVITSIPGPITVPTGSTSVKIMEITLGPEHYGTNNQYRVKYTHTLTSAGWSMSHLRINGVKVTPTIVGTSSCSYDATGLKAGDKIQIWTLLGTTNPGFDSNNGLGNITNFQLCGKAELIHGPPTNPVTL